MTNIDQFESVFKSAAKPQFEYAKVSVKQMAVVTDIDRESSRGLAEMLEQALAGAPLAAETDVRVVSAEDYCGVSDLLEKLDEARPELIATYRNLHIPAREHPYSLGVYLDVLTQATPTPVLVLPRERGKQPGAQLQCDRVMAITDHLTGDARLVNCAIAFTRPNGTLYLTHIEDEIVFERYIETGCSRSRATTSRTPAANSKNTDSS